MVWGLLGALAAIAALVGWFMFRGNAYRRLFADSHFLEVARGVGGIKAAAIRAADAGEVEVRSREDPRILMTSAGLAVLYTASRETDRFVHHYSVSVAGGHTARAVGDTFVLFIAKLLGVPFESLALSVGESGAHHAEFQLSPAEQPAYAARPIRSVTETDLARFRSEWAQAREHLQWQRA